MQRETPLDTTTDAPLPATAHPTAALWEQRLRTIVITIVRLGVAYMFFTNLFWKLPPRFGCANDFAFPTANAEGRPVANGSTGLCYWTGLESVYAPQERRVLIADTRAAGGPDFAIDIRPLAQLNAAFLDGLVIPNIRIFGWLIFGAEAFIVLSLALGLLSRLGALTAVGIAAQLWIGLANIPQPFEWEWSYGLMVLVALALFAIAPGRYFGLDALLRPRVLRAAAQGNRLARLIALAM